MAVSSKLPILFSFFFLLVSSHCLAGEDPSASSYRNLLDFLKNRRNSENQISSCGEMMSRSLCLGSPNCRWCHGEALDDMCFSKAEAWRLPHQVFLCD